MDVLNEKLDKFFKFGGVEGKLKGFGSKMWKMIIEEENQPDKEE